MGTKIREVKQNTRIIKMIIKIKQLGGKGKRLNKKNQISLKIRMCK